MPTAETPTSTTKTTGLELRSKLTSDGDLELSLEEVTPPALGPGDVLIRVDAAPINPTDLGLMLASADASTLRSGGTPDRPTVAGSVPRPRLAKMAGRLDTSMPVGLEGAGVVVQAGADVQSLLERTVATSVGGMFAEYRVAPAAECVVLPAGATAKEGASAYVNPMTALSMVETMRREGHSALVHTAAASNLGQMLNRVCLADGIAVVNIVRSAEQAALLADLGARHVLDSTSSSFVSDLTDALDESGATLAFDAIGGGTLAETILSGMEQVASRRATTYSRYGSTTHKQVYFYGGLDTGPTELSRGYGMAWGVGGWLLMPFLASLAPEELQGFRDRVAGELTTTFASHYAAEISLTEALSLETIAAYSKRTTGEKHLMVPSRRRA